MIEKHKAEQPTIELRSLDDSKLLGFEFICPADESTIACEDQVAVALNKRGEGPPA